MDAICKPLAIAICTSDVHTVWEGAVGERHDMILGHECCAEVVEVGADVKDFKPGDRVLVPAITPDWNSLEAQAGYAMHSGAKKYGASDIINYKNGPIEDQVMRLTDGKGVDRVIIAGGTVDTFASAVKALKPGGKIGSVNYLGSGDSIRIPRVEWGVGMGHKAIVGGLMPGGRLRMEKLGALVAAGKLDVSLLSTHVYEGWDKLPGALQLMKDKPADVIKPVVVLER